MVVEMEIPAVHLPSALESYNISYFELSISYSNLASSFQIVYSQLHNNMIDLWNEERWIYHRLNTEAWQYPAFWEGSIIDARSLTSIHHDYVCILLEDNAYNSQCSTSV